MMKILGDMAVAIATVANPIAGIVVKGIVEVVNKKGDGISNDSILIMVKEAFKSKWNNGGENLYKILEVGIMQDEITDKQRDRAIQILKGADNG